MQLHIGEPRNSWVRVFDTPRNDGAQENHCIYPSRNRPEAMRGRRATVHRARVSTSQIPPPIMNPPEMRDNARVRRVEKNKRARPARSA